jgi:hypothetical protein
MAAKLRQRAIPLALAALGALALAAPAARAGDAEYEGISADGEVAVFSTNDKLVPGDTDNQRDVYTRAYDEGLGSYVTRAVSLGPSGGNDAYPAQFLAIAPGGEAVFFSTEERLVAEDTDGAEDIYVRDLILNGTTLVSAGSAACAAEGCGDGDVDAGADPAGFVDGGAKVFFLSTEQLAPGDSDGSLDIYLRDLAAETTTLVSVAGTPCAGSCGNGAAPAFFQGAAEDGSRAIFTSAEVLASADLDSEIDLYAHDTGGETRLVSAPGPGPEACPGEPCAPVNSGISADGSHVFFETNERALAGDGDEFQDVYGWTDGGLERLSLGPLGGNGEELAVYEGSSADGSEVFFATAEQLISGDTDSVVDVYLRSEGASTELVSAGDSSCAPGCGSGSGVAKLEWIAADGSLAVLVGAEALTAADGDAKADVYTRTLPGGPTTLVSAGATACAPGCGDGDHNAFFAGASTDGERLFFVSDEVLVPPAEGDSSGPGDRDAVTDVHERSAGTTSLVSVGQLTGSGPYTGNGEFAAQLQGVSADGSRAFMVTGEQLTGEDSDNSADVYMRAPGGTVLVSRSNDPELEAALAPPAPLLEATDPASPGSSTTPKVQGSEPEEASIKLYATADCSGKPVATGSSAALQGAGIAATVGAGTTTTFRASAEADGFISPCSNGIAYKHESGGGSSGGGSSSGGGGASSPPPPAPAPPELGDEVKLAYATPLTRITFGPAFKTRARRPVFRFTDATGQAGTRFICKLDRRRWRPCSSPARLRKLSRGRHVFRVRGVNARGEREPRARRRAFKLVGGKQLRTHRRQTRRGRR